MYRPFLAALLGLLSVLLPRPSSAAVDEAALLPVDEAFVLQAHAPSRERIELQWRIADGYYLYRHQIRVKASGGFTGGEFAYQAANAVVFFIVITIVSLLQFRVLQRREADF